MLQRLLLLFCLAAFAKTLQAQHEVPTIANAFLRKHSSLNGDWQHFPDRYEAYFYDFVRVPFDSSKQGRGDFAAMDDVAQNRTDRYEYAFDGAPVLHVPGDWNSQYERYLLYEGSIWYRKRFAAPARAAGERVHLYFGAANYRADVYVNGRKAGVHEGGFTSFQFDITTLLRGGDSLNSLVVRVDNQRSRGAVPTDVTDWWNYGGLTRDVSLYVLPATRIANYQIQLADAKTLTGVVELHGPRRAESQVRIECPELGFGVSLKTQQPDDQSEFDLEPALLQVARVEHEHAGTKSEREHGARAHDDRVDAPLHLDELLEEDRACRLLAVVGLRQVDEDPQPVE